MKIAGLFTVAMLLLQVLYVFTCKLHFLCSASCLSEYPGETYFRVEVLKRDGLKILDQVAIAEKNGLGCNYRVAGTTTSRFREGRR